MLTGIRLRNFKCFEELNLEKLGRINVFIGPNGSGKSSVLQALMALRQSVNDSVLKMDGPFIDLGNYLTTVFNGDTQRKIGIGISLRRELLSEPLEADYDACFRDAGKHG